MAFKDLFTKKPKILTPEVLPSSSVDPIAIMNIVEDIIQFLKENKDKSKDTENFIDDLKAKQEANMLNVDSLLWMIDNRKDLTKEAINYAYFKIIDSLSPEALNIERKIK